MLKATVAVAFAVVALTTACKSTTPDNSAVLDAPGRSAMLSCTGSAVLDAAGTSARYTLTASRTAFDQLQGIPVAVTVTKAVSSNTANPLPRTTTIVDRANGRLLGRNVNFAGGSMINGVLSVVSDNVDVHMTCDGDAPVQPEPQTEIQPITTLSWICEGSRILGPDMSSMAYRISFARSGFDQQANIPMTVTLEKKMNSNTARPSQWQTVFRAADGRLVSSETALMLAFATGSLNATSTVRGVVGTLSLDGQQPVNMTCQPQE